MRPAFTRALFNHPRSDQSGLVLAQSRTLGRHDTSTAIANAVATSAQSLPQSPGVIGQIGATPRGQAGKVELPSRRRLIWKSSGDIVEIDYPGRIGVPRDLSLAGRSRAAATSKSAAGGGATQARASVRRDAPDNCARLGAVSACPANPDRLLGISWSASPVATRPACMVLAYFTQKPDTLRATERDN